MEYLAFADQMKQLDEKAIWEYGIGSLDLMEQAAQALTEVVLAQLPHREQASGQEDSTPAAAIFCGSGNNGGDGVAAARLLRERGVLARAFLVGDRTNMTEDTQAMEEKLLAAGGVLEDFLPEDGEQQSWFRRCTVMVDAIFGVGLNRPLSGRFLEAVQLMNRERSPFCKIVSCDVPSGIHSDTGAVQGEAVRADVTVTFTCAKPGLYLNRGREYGGTVLVKPIGIPRELVRAHIEQNPPVRVLGPGRYILPRRSRTAHKGDFGRLFILAGSEGYTGAPVLAAKAAVRTGTGLVFLGVPRSIYPIVAVKCDEAMPFPLPEDYADILNRAQSCDVALIGPGLGRGEAAEQLVLSLLKDLTIPVVLDADGINALQGHIDVLTARQGLTVLTPHEGEFQRLTGCELPLQDRLNAAKGFAEAHNCVMILKGHTTITAAPDGGVFLNASGNPGMAKGGSGDVLAGMLAALLAQKQLAGEAAELCAIGVWYHGIAGDRCAQRLGEYGMTPSDMIAEIPYVLKENEYKY